MVKDHIECLPPLEQDIVRLHLDLGRTHTDIARILGMSQPAVYYRYQRARERLDYLNLLPPVTPFEVRAVLKELSTKETDIEVLGHYVETNSQSEVARILDISQGRVRYSLMRSLRLLEKDLSHEDRHVRVRQACSLLINKPGIFTTLEHPTIRHKVLEPKTILLPVAPKVTPRATEGARVLFQEGLYKSLHAQIESVEALVTALLDLRSQEIRLQWAK